MSVRRALLQSTLAWCCLAAAILVLCSQDLIARNNPSQRGREFWVGFMPAVQINPLRKFLLTIVAERPTRGRLVYTRSGRREQISIPDAGVPVRVTLGPEILPTTTVSNRPDSNTVHLLFDDDVSVYALMTQATDGDAFLALPAEALGNEYIVIAYPNSLIRDEVVRDRHLSQFAVIATKDSTRIDVASSTDAGAITVVLDQGEMYIGRNQNPSVPRNPKLKPDLFGDASGSIITADKPVVVYGGHTRANIPNDSVSGINHLVEQLPPVRFWGTGFYLAPNYMPGQTVRRTEIVRLVASEDGTDLKIGGRFAQTIGRGDVYEMPLEQGVWLESSRPVLVAQFHPSSPLQRFPVILPADSIGDPSMMLVQPALQFDTLYRVESFDVPEYPRHFFTLIVPFRGRETLVMDGAPLNPPLLEIPGSGHGYAVIEVTPGLHTVHASVPFGLSVYGYGYHNAYAYPGGMLLKPPVVSAGEGNPGDARELDAVLAANPIVGGKGTLRMILPGEERASVEVLDLRGGLISRPVAGRMLNAGENEVVFSTGSLPPGTYLCRVVTESGSRTLKMAVVR